MNNTILVQPKTILEALKIAPNLQEYILEDFDGQYMDIKVYIYNDGSFKIDDLNPSDKIVAGVINWCVDMNFSRMVPAHPTWERFKGVLIMPSISIIGDTKSTIGNPNESEKVIKALQYPDFRLKHQYAMQTELDDELSEAQTFFDTLNIAFTAIINNSFERLSS